MFKPDLLVVFKRNIKLHSVWYLDTVVIMLHVQIDTEVLILRIVVGNVNTALPFIFSSE